MIRKPASDAALRMLSAPMVSTRPEAASKSSTGSITAAHPLAGSATRQLTVLVALSKNAWIAGAPVLVMLLTDKSISPGLASAKRKEGCRKPNGTAHCRETTGQTD